MPAIVSTANQVDGHTSDIATEELITTKFSDGQDGTPIVLTFPASTGFLWEIEDAQISTDLATTVISAESPSGTVVHQLTCAAAGIQPTNLRGWRGAVGEVLLVKVSFTTVCNVNVKARRKQDFVTTLAGF